MVNEFHLEVQEGDRVMKNKNEIARIIKGIRLEKYMTMRELADEINNIIGEKSCVDKSYIHKWESGKYIPSDIHLNAISKLDSCEYSLDELLEFKDKGK